MQTIWIIFDNTREGITEFMASLSSNTSSCHASEDIKTVPTDMLTYGSIFQDRTTLETNSGLMVFAAILFTIQSAPVYYNFEDIQRLRSNTICWIANGGTIP
jgi:hypothetical protein